MWSSQGQTIFTAATHGLLTADFEASGIDVSAFGFYGQPAFLARESANPAYLDRYAEWVLTRPRSPAYEAHVRATVSKLAHLLGAAFAAHDARGRCLAASSMMTRMLDRLHVWSFCLFGSVVLEAPALDMRSVIQTIAFNDDPEAVAGHAWVCAPPYLIVDMSLALQHCDPAMARLVPDVVLDGHAAIIEARVEDCVHERVRAMFAHIEGWRDPELHHRLDPSLQGFLRTFPAREVVVGDLNMRFVPIAIRQPSETLAEIEMTRGGPLGTTIWNSIVAPVFECEQTLQVNSSTPPW